MREKTKTIFKRFNYMHCDDFAQLLNDMARKGWHFKEWGVGLKFEKGEPENATYAVEVFTKASENDMRPELHTQEFAEYCEAAGWKFVDAKQKFCIFKKVDENAVELFTQEERVANSFKSMMLVPAFLLLIVYGFNIWMQWTSIFRFFEESIFSGLTILNISIWTMLFLGQLYPLVSAIWKRRCLLKNIREGKEVYIGSQKNRKYKNGQEIYLSVLLEIFFLSYCLFIGRMELFMVNIVILSIVIIFSVWIGKKRPESSLNVLLQIGLSLVIMVIMVLFTAIILLDDSEKISLKKDELPLVVSDYREYSEEIVDVDIYHDSNFLGSKDTYYVFAEDDGFTYTIYQSKYTKILDKIWEKQLDKRENKDTIDCTKDWEAKKAFRDTTGTYYVRYENSILILGEDEDIYLDTEQIYIICNELGIK